MADPRLSDPMPLPDRAHVLYRMYDKARCLLYVGITFDPAARWQMHGESKPWWRSVAHVDVEHFECREDALAAERSAIREDRPLYNVVHRWKPESKRLSSGERMKHRNVRMDSRTWFAAARIAEIQGQRISDVVRELLRGYVSKNSKVLAGDAKWAAKLAEIEEEELAA